MQVLQLWIFAPPHFDENAEALAEARAEVARAPSLQPQLAFEAQCDACITHDALDRLSLVTCPTLVVAGEDDIFTPLGFSQEIAAGISGAELLSIPRTGHAVHWEALAEFNEKSRDFMLAHG